MCFNLRSEFRFLCSLPCLPGQVGILGTKITVWLFCLICPNYWYLVFKLDVPWGSLRFLEVPCFTHKDIENYQKEILKRFTSTSKSSSDNFRLYFGSIETKVCKSIFSLVLLAMQFWQNKTFGQTQFVTFISDQSLSRSIYQGLTALRPHLRERGA